MDNLYFPLQFNIELRIYSGAMTPDRVAGILGARRFIAQWAGNPSMSPWVRRGSIWQRSTGGFFSSEDRVESRDPRRHIDWFLAEVAPLHSKLPSLLKSPGVRADINIMIWSNDSGDLSLDPTDLAALAALKIPMWVSYRHFAEERDGDAEVSSLPVR